MFDMFSQTQNANMTGQQQITEKNSRKPHNLTTPVLSLALLTGSLQLFSLLYVL